MTMIIRSRKDRTDAYNKFHNDNKGFFWKDKNTGKIHEKLELFNNLYPEHHTQLDLLTKDCHPNFKKLDKPGWHNGILI